jgi:hypothetical protein
MKTVTNSEIFSENCKQDFYAASFLSRWPFFYIGHFSLDASFRVTGDFLNAATSSLRWVPTLIFRIIFVYVEANKIFVFDFIYNIDTKELTLHYFNL